MFGRVGPIVDQARSTTHRGAGRASRNWLHPISKPYSQVRITLLPSGWLLSKKSICCRESKTFAGGGITLFAR